MQRKKEKEKKKERKKERKKVQLDIRSREADGSPFPLPLCTTSIPPQPTTHNHTPCLMIESGCVLIEGELSLCKDLFIRS